MRPLLLNYYFFFRRWGFLVSSSNPQSGGPGYPFLSRSSTFTCPSWEALPAATKPPPQFSGLFDYTSPTTTSEYKYLRGEVPEALT